MRSSKLLAELEAAAELGLAAFAGLAAFLSLASMIGCSVPDKQAIAGDAGMDAVANGSGDSSAPETSLDDAPPAFSRTRTPTFVFSSNDPQAIFECRIDDEMVQRCQSPYARSLADGSHRFSVRAIDAAGNMDKTPAETVWTIDTKAPETTLATQPPSADNSVMAQFGFTSNEENVEFDCSLDNAAFAPCTSGASFGPVGDGAHAFAVRARDRAGNVDATPAFYAWTVDTSTPDTQILSAPPAASASTAASFTFVSPDAGGGATFLCALDGAAFAACTSPVNYASLAEGEHTFAVRVRDAVGNQDPTPATRTWTVDLTAPSTTITDGPSGIEPSASATIAFTASETGVTFACSLDGGAYAACTSPAGLMQLAQGAHAFAVRATDAAGHTDASPATVNWTVDTVAPEVTISSAPAASSGPRVAFAFAADEGALACSLDGGAFATCTSPFATNLPAGAHTFTVRATDAAGNKNTATKSWSVACAAPDAAGAIAALHLDAANQTLDNAVAGGAPATLGDDATVEAGDPAGLAAGRFGGALTFTASDSDHVAWPVALPAVSAIAIELWAKPGAPSGARDVLTSGDGRIAVRATAASATTVRFTATIVEGGTGGATRTATSAAVEAGAWHHVLVSLGGSTLRLWVDGARTEVADVVPATPLALDALRLGGDVGTAYDGAIDEVWLSSTAITSDEPALARYCPL